MKNPASTFWTVNKEGICSVHMHPGQKAVWNSKRRFVFMIAGSQGGKALDADTLIPTPAGFRKISELSAGDSVFGSDGKSAGVTFHSGLMFNHRCYRLSFDDGTSIIADAEHLWTAQTYKQRKNERRRMPANPQWTNSRPQCRPSDDFSIVTTEQMAGNVHATNGGSNYSIALPSAIEYQVANLPVPPYTFGAWLGDGTSSKPFITSADEEVVQRIRNEGIWIERDAAGSKRTGKASSYRIGKPNPRGGNDRTKSPVFLELAQLSVLSNKHIPDCYLTANKEQRLELLRGLMDTDGYATDHGRVEFDSTNKRLADGVAELVRSLGVKARISTGRATLYGRDCGKKYTVTFFPNFPVFYVKRKAARQYNPTRPDVNNLYVVGIEEVESRPVCCIAVSAYNSLYVAGREYILTHNTSYGPWWLNREIDRMGAGDYLAITTSYDLFKLKMLPEMKTVFERLLQRGRYWPGDKLIELRDPETGQFWAKRSQDDMWGRIILRSTQSEGGLESATAKAAWLDEVGQDDFSLQNWEAVLRRLSIHQGRVLGTTTLYNLGWLKTEIFDRWKAGDTDYDVVQFDSVVNPSFPKAEFERAEKSLPSWRFNMFYRGQFTKPAGLIYADFLDSYVINPFHIPNHWQVAVGVDFGGANTCLIWAAQDPVSEIWYIYDEYLAGGKSTREHASSVFAHADENKESIEDMTFVGGSMSERQARIDWAEAGIRVAAPPFDSVEPGIDKVTEVMKSNHLRVFRTCAGWRDEIGTYRREMDTDGQVSDKISQKRKFHRMDATRYLFSHIIGRGGVDVIGLGSYPGLGRM
jgi:hypothetical protein